MGTEIYYFSGTGNSLHVARELQERIPETTLVPMVSLFDKDVVETQAETVGFVFPIYTMFMPYPVKRFIKKLDLRSAEYIFAASTKGGTMSIDDIRLREILKEKGKHLDAYFSLKMSWNSPAGLMPVSIPGVPKWPIPDEMIQELESDVQYRLDSIQKTIVNREKNPQDDSPRALSLAAKRSLSMLMASTEKNQEGTEIGYYCDSACTGCGICEKVCLSKKVKMVNGKPVWQKDVNCYFCYACFSFCPERAILVKRVHEKRDERYSHPAIKANDIAGQK
jgi:ferredoxin